MVDFPRINGERELSLKSLFTDPVGEIRAGSRQRNILKKARLILSARERYALTDSMRAQPFHY